MKDFDFDKLRKAAKMIIKKDRKIIDKLAKV